ncbi:MAG: rhomboid family intramembrane serine protease [Gammaproteobacteria bacterium]|nr:rhomboid family intramembrane serine protease [Pseudomonadales bacterium]MCP5346005.1 rhomboid family intramembrane serine protease [Pseudomonadales bacterium]
MIRVLEVDIDKNLRDVSRYLWQQGVQHRIIEESGKQVVLVRDEHQAAAVRELVQQYLDGRVKIAAPTPISASQTQRPIESTWLYRILHVVIRAPVCSLLTAVSVLVALVTQLGARVDRMDYLFYPSLPTQNLFSLLGAINSPQELLQTLTPIFLHFGSLHIVFNLLWLWYFGLQLEKIQSSWLILLVVLLTAFAGNTAQYLHGGAANFGGLSGVVYGLVGYAWVLHHFVPSKRLKVNESLFLVFLVALVLMEVFAGSWIASAAHVGGLIAGLFCGGCVLLASRKIS